MQENYRLISYDTETTQEILMDNGNIKHTVNFIGAHVFCLHCINNGRWKEELLPNECQVCGDKRFLSWAAFPTHNPNLFLNHSVTENPIRDFLKWVLTGTNKKFTSHCFAHNAGRFGKHIT
jgi:hypothetical protein